MIYEVTNGSCASVTDGSFVIEITPFAVAKMHNAGLIDQKYYDCLVNSLADYAAWKKSLIHHAFNPFLRTDSGISVTDEIAAMALMTKWRATLGRCAVLANQNLISGPKTPKFPKIISSYEAFQKLGPLIDL